jgi:FkbH-like protein
VVTAEARRRGQLYAERRQRQAAQQSFGGIREEFLRSVGTDVSIARAGRADLPRLAELAVRTRQFNSAAGPGGGQAPAGPAPQDWFAGLLADPRTDVLAVRLRDSFGDDGLVGACVVARGDPAAWTVRLLMISCRAMGRGVAEALLAWLTRRAASEGARMLWVPCTLDERNLPLRLALAGAGFRATSPVPAGPADGPVPAASPATAVFARDLAGPLPRLASWVHPDPETPLPGAGPETA